MAFAGDDELAALQDVHPALRDSMQLPSRSLAAELPGSVLDVLLSLVDAPTFASLAVLNRHWRTRCSTARLYAYHLADSTVQGSPAQETSNAEDLVALRRRLAQVARQNLFPVFRPRLATYHIVAPAVLSPSSSPHGEFFSYSFSSRSHHLVVYSACRLFVLDIQYGQPMVKRVLSIKQRPLAVDVSDDGLKLAMLVSELKLKVFSLHAEQAAQTHSFMLEEPARTICLTPDATLVAAAQEDCIELFALIDIPGRVPRRIVACEGVSHVAFSQNGKLLLGSHTRSAKASTTVISAPEDMGAGFGDEDGEDDAPKEAMAIMWISRPLFPTAFEKTTHAALLPGDDLALLAYDEPADSFGILDANIMSFSTSLLAVPSEFLQPSSLPCVTARGDMAAIPFSRSGLRVLSLSDVTPGDQYDNPAKQRWIPFTKAVSRARWQLDNGFRQRLFATGAGKSSHPELLGAADDEQRETGSIFVFEFDHHVDATKAKDVIINLDSLDVETLQMVEEIEDPAVSVQKRPASRASDRPKNAPLARSVTAARRKQRAQVPAVPEVTGPENEVIAADAGADVPEEQLMDEVYHPSQPRPQATLIRSASTIAARREREPPRFLANAQPRLRRAGDPSEVPDESDADNWVPPPPAYDGGQEGSQRRRSDVRGSRLPPVPPERSPNRPRLTLNTSTSTPDLHVPTTRAQAERAEAHARADPRKPNKLQRPKQKRVKSAVENARKSLVMSSQNVRRAFSGPSNDVESKPLPERPVEQPPMPQPSVRSTRPRPPAPTPARKPVAVPAAAPVPRPSRSAEPTPDPTPRVPRQRPVSVAAQPESAPKRRSVLQRPLSFASSGLLESRPSNRRSISQPLPGSNSLHAIPYPGSPDSPSLPEASQMTSLHRRQTSGSISSMNSNLSGMAPRAAVGAVRAGTNPSSPWASSTMLATLSEGSPDDNAVQSPVSGRPLSGQYSPRATGPPPRRLQEARRSLNASGLAAHQRTASYSSTDSPSRPSTSPQQPDDRALDGREPREKRPETSGAGSGRLTAIQSIASTLKERSRSRGSPSARAAGVQRSNSKRDRQGGVTSVNIADAKKKGKGFFAKWKKTLFSSLESV